jgi:hypothetical protein
MSSRSRNLAIEMLSELGAGLVADLVRELLQNFALEPPDHDRVDLRPALL